MNQLIQNELLPEETVLWSGQPASNVIFTKGDLFLVPFSIVWGGFAIFWEYGVLMTGVTFFALFGIPFVIIGLYLMIGRFFYRHYIRTNTYYYVTQKRILILKDTKTRRLEAEFISSIPCINKRVDFNGDGTIIFGNSSGAYDMYQDSGLEFMITSSRYQSIAPTFYDIDNADKVYKLVNELRFTAVNN